MQFPTLTPQELHCMPVTQRHGAISALSIASDRIAVTPLIESP